MFPCYDSDKRALIYHLDVWYGGVGLLTPLESSMSVSRGQNDISVDLQPKVVVESSV